MSEAMATARLTASVVRPTPPLGENRVMTRPASRSTGTARALLAWGWAAYRPIFSRSRACTPRIAAHSSSELNGLTRNSRAPASIERRR